MLFSVYLHQLGCDLFLYLLHVSLPSSQQRADMKLNTVYTSESLLKKVFAYIKMSLLLHLCYWRFTLMESRCLYNIFILGAEATVGPGLNPTSGALYRMSFPFYLPPSFLSLYTILSNKGKNISLYWITCLFDVFQHTLCLSTGFVVLRRVSAWRSSNCFFPWYMTILFSWIQARSATLPKNWTWYSLWPAQQRRSQEWALSISHI